jgi:hypothetical protein
MRPALLVLALAACDGASSDSGRDAWLRVSGAQFVPEKLTTTADGPSVVALNLSRSQATRGDTALHLSGTLGSTANAVAIWLNGDRGFWLLPAGLPDVTLDNALTFASTVGLSLEAPLGARTVTVVALSHAGIAGPPSEAALEILDTTKAQGALVVTLQWDTDADLDLHVVDSAGVEIWARNPNSWQATPGAPLDPTAWKRGGLLDADSNSQCVIDGRNQENIVWSTSAPSGHYLVRVDTFSLCDQSAARWTVSARTADGTQLGLAQGIATPASARPPHDLGAGVRALEFDLP